LYGALAASAQVAGGTFSLIDGSSGSPSLSWLSQPGFGIWRTGTSTMELKADVPPPTSTYDGKAGLAITIPQDSAQNSYLFRVGLPDGDGVAGSLNPKILSVRSDQGFFVAGYQFINPYTVGGAPYYGPTNQIDSSQLLVVNDGDHPTTSVIKAYGKQTWMLNDPNFLEYVTDTTYNVGAGAFQGTTVYRVTGRGAIYQAGVKFADLGTSPNGTMIMCIDCQETRWCRDGGTGAFAKRLNGRWVCN